MGKSIYVIAFIALVAIFFVTIFSVKIYEDQTFYSINEQLRQIQLESQFETIFYDLVDNPNAYCEGRNIQISLSTKRLELLDLELKAQKESFLGNYIPTKKAFLITNLLLYYNVIKTNKECGNSIIPVIYFYAEDNSCDVECRTIENQLEKLKINCPNLRVFAFPYNWDQFEFSKIIEKEFEVEKAGTIIINDKRFDALTSQQDLINALNCN